MPQDHSEYKKEVTGWGTPRRFPFDPARDSFIT
jgi:hypothetical protein